MGKTKQYTVHMYHRIISIAVFSILFVLVGWAVPQTYFNYVDSKDYYVVDNPITIGESTYKPCEQVKMIIHRNAYFDGIVHKVEELTKVNGTVVVEDKNISEFNVAYGEETLIINYDIPCDVSLGRYIIRGALEYRVNGVQKTGAYVTELFEIVE